MINLRSVCRTTMGSSWYRTYNVLTIQNRTPVLMGATPRILVKINNGFEALPDTVPGPLNTKALE